MTCHTHHDIDFESFIPTPTIYS